MLASGASPPVRISADGTGNSGENDDAKARHHDVRAVAWNDHQGALVQHVQEVAHVHGGNFDVADIAFHVGQARDLPHAEGRGHLAGGGPGDLLQLRQDIYGPLGCTGLDLRGNGLQQLRIRAVHHDGQQCAPFRRQFLAGNLDGGGRLGDAEPLRAHHGNDGRGQVVGQPGIEVKFDGGVLAGEVRPLDDHHVAVPGDLGEDFHAAGIDVCAFTFRQERPHLGGRQTAPAPVVVEREA